MKKWIIVLISILVISILIQPNIMMRVNLFAKGAVLMDGETGEILYSKNKDIKLYPASITKVLTALIVLENIDLTDKILVGDEIKLIPDDSSVAGIRAGMYYTVEDLLMGLMLVSGNDAANALAVYTARQLSGEGHNMGIDEAIEYFVDLMNEKAHKLGAQNSHFNNPHGCHDKDHYTTAYDMAIITREIYKFPIILEIAGTARHEGDDLKWTNTNYMVVEGSTGYYEYATGLKTGYTSQAKYCLITTAEKSGQKLISVILKSSSRGRWRDARALMDYGFGDKRMNINKVRIIRELLKDYVNI